MAPPQTPRKTKLTVDIPSSYSDNSCPDSPSSQYVASPVFTPSRHFEGSVPASPTFSGTLNSNRSQAELTALLKEAYNTIRDREKDLTLAAEIGKSLLENNIALKSKYESAIVQLQHLQRARSKAATFTIQNVEKHAAPIAPPNTSLENISENEYDEISDTESLQGWSTSFDLPSPSGDVPFKRKSPRNSSGLNYKDLENIKELETRNQELQQHLDEAIREYNDCDKSNKSKIRKLESDLQHYIEACTLATQKVEDLEKENDRLIQKQKNDFWNLKYTKKSNENENFIETLLHKVQDLEDQNHLIEKAKVEIERRLQRTTTELETFKKEYNDLLETSKDYERLQLVTHEQQQYIAELSESLEEQRALVVNYRSGMWSAKTSRANSISDSGGIMSNALRRLSDPDGMRAMFGAAPKQNNQDNGIGGKIKKSLLSELENEWFRELTIFQRDVKKGNGSGASSPSFSPISSEKDLNQFFLDNGARLDDEMVDYLSDDEFSFLDEFEVDNEKANRLREWFWIRWARAIYLFLRKIWRWCRFILILVAAVIMALYRGPDDVLPNDV
ncbi:hypothetical protein C1646_817978 [Rhizophagus diaphanus]|nr:hypothetical protein C1646_817978 [Rhizophagus diaphanus] [Rhizophagus sp. MUCL 43196]